MVTDTLKNYQLYESLHVKFKDAFTFIHNFYKEEQPDGRYEIDGNRLFALVQSYKTLPADECKWETHDKYIDIQFIVRGKEIIGYAPRDVLKTAIAYQEDKDITFYQDQPATDICLTDGMYAIFYPWDGHKPKCIYSDETHVKKIVIKVLL